MADLLDSYPSIGDLKQRAVRRLPHFVWEQLEGGTGEDQTCHRNRMELDRIAFYPRHSKEKISPVLNTTLFDQQYSAPFGIAPVGTTGLFWPGGERILAQTAARRNIPYCLSAVACDTPENIGPLSGPMGWFQLYPPNNLSDRDDLLERAKNSGFKTLVITVDVPAYGLRERPRRAGLRTPPHLTLRTGWQIALRPHWAMKTLLNGAPGFPTITPYLQKNNTAHAADYVLTRLHGTIDGDYLKYLRASWPGPLIVKGILHPDDAAFAVDHGADGIIVSNHGGRQFDGAISSIEALPAIVKAVGGTTSILLDSGLNSGLDIVRAIAYGADFVLLGRAFIYGIAALGEQGGDHVYRILREDLQNNMIQLGVRNIKELRAIQKV